MTEKALFRPLVQASSRLSSSLPKRPSGSHPKRRLLISDHTRRCTAVQCRMSKVVWTAVQGGGASTRWRVPGACRLAPRAAAQGKLAPRLLIGGPGRLRPPIGSQGRGVVPRDGRERHAFVTSRAFRGACVAIVRLSRRRPVARALEGAIAPLTHRTSGSLRQKARGSVDSCVLRAFSTPRRVFLGARVRRSSYQTAYDRLDSTSGRTRRGRVRPPVPASPAPGWRIPGRPIAGRGSGRNPRLRGPAPSLCRPSPTTFRRPTAPRGASG